jgi:hypothetical protein
MIRGNNPPAYVGCPALLWTPAAGDKPGGGVKRLDMQVVTSTGPADHQTGGPQDARGAAVPGAGELGHGFGAVLRRQPAPGAHGLPEGAHATLFELICFECGDNPCLDYSQVSVRLQRIRGPRTMETAWAAYEQHLGLALLTAGAWMRAAT